MATMIPDRCPSKATQGEHRLFQLLQDQLPKEYTVCYEPDIRGRYPDFTILAPTLGLLTLETKGWFINQMSRVTDHDVELLRSREGESRIERHQNPIRQVRDYMFRVMDLLAEEPLLRQGGGPHRGKLCFPCGYGVVFTNITRGQLGRTGLGGLFSEAVALCRDEVDAIQGRGAD